MNLSLSSKERASLAFKKATKNLSTTREISVKAIGEMAGIEELRYNRIRHGSAKPTEEEILAVEKVFPGFAHSTSAWFDPSHALKQSSGLSPPFAPPQRPQYFTARNMAITSTADAVVLDTLVLLSMDIIFRWLHGRIYAQEASLCGQVC